MLITQAHYKLSYGKKIALNLILLGLYFLLDEAGFLYRENVNAFLPVVPSSGLSLAIILVFGLPQVLPAILIGNLLLAYEVPAPLVTTLGLGSVKIFEAILSSMLLRTIGKGRFRFKSVRDVFAFICLAGFLSPFVSSTLSITFVYLDGASLGQITDIWGNFFTSRILGVLMFTPFLLTFFDKEVYEQKASFKEGLLLYSVLGLICYWAFEARGARLYLMIPFLTLAAFRFSFRGVSLASFVVLCFGIWRSISNWEALFATFSEAQIWLQSMCGGIACIGYFMSTIRYANETANETEKELRLNRRNTKIAEEALAILDQSLHKSPIGFALIDRDYKYIRINETLARINGASTEDHIGKTVHEMIPSTKEKVVAMIDRVFETGTSLMNVPFHGQMAGNQSETISGFVSYYPIRHPGTNEIFSVAFSFQDVTQLFKTQNLLRENQERLTFAQEAGRIGAFEWCLDTNHIIWTSELENIYGLEQGEFGGFFEGWMKWVHPEDIEATREEFKKVLSEQKELNHEFRIISKNHEVRWILARGKMLEGDDEKVKLIGINIDLTEQKSYVQQLRLTEANLLHALAVRDEFVATASHELKTPLTSLKLQIQMYQRGVEKNVQANYMPEKVHALLEKNSRQIDRLTRLVDDMLDISRIRTGKLSLKKEFCDLNFILQEILLRTKEQFLSSGCGLPIIEHIDQASGEWDPLRIEQVLTNIITNAIRYGEGKPVRISITNYNECVRIRIKDQGLGIPKSDQAKIFQRYERGMLHREVSGLGLGLFITQQIVEAHGGRIWVESEINDGATFFVDLPRIIEIHNTQAEDRLTELEM